MLPIASDYPFLNIVWTMLVFFALVIWIRLLFTVFADLFRRHDISGWAKAGWCLLAIVLPFVGVLIYPRALEKTASSVFGKSPKMAWESQIPFART